MIVWVQSNWQILAALLAWLFLSLAPRIHPPTSPTLRFVWCVFERLMLFSWDRWGGKLCPGWVDPPPPPASKG